MTDRTPTPEQWKDAAPSSPSEPAGEEVMSDPGNRPLPDSGLAGVLSDALDLVHDDLTRYVAFPSPEAVDALTLWIAATHCQDLWETAPRFVLKSPVKKCGKTRAATVVRYLVDNPLVTGNISAAALVRLIPERPPPSIVLDEADAVFSRKDDSAEALRSILNLGFTRGWPYHRATEKGDVRQWPTFGMALLCSIGDLPDTIEDRAVVVSMQRRAPNERVSPLRERDGAGFSATKTALSHALKLTLKRFDSYDPPEMPVEDRAADVWEPLVAIAEAAGGDWPERARRACVELTANDEDDYSLGVKLLTDLRVAWGDEEVLATATILERLRRLDESPWRHFFGGTFTPRDLARLLRPFGPRPRVVRIGDQTPRGYARSDLHPVWDRYLPVADVADVADVALSGGGLRPGEIEQGTPRSEQQAQHAQQPDKGDTLCKWCEVCCGEHSAGCPVHLGMVEPASQ